MAEQIAGYRELEHIADVELEVWAPDMPSLLEQAARGLYALSGVTFRNGTRVKRSLEINAPDGETLLVSFLSELLYLNEVEGLAFDTFDLKLNGNVLLAHLEGAPIQSQAKEIKAVTYHKLAIRKGERGLEVNVIFDI